MFKKTFSMNMTRMRLTVSSSQLIMLNCTKTRFLLFLKTLADMLMPVTFSSCLFLKLKKKRLNIFCTMRLLPVNCCVTDRGDHHAAAEAYEGCDVEWVSYRKRP